MGDLRRIAAPCFAVSMLLASGCGEEGEQEQLQTHTFALDECDTTSQCKQIWGPTANDCLDSRSDSSVCMCGDDTCENVHGGGDGGGGDGGGGDGGGGGGGDGGGGGVSIPARIEAESFTDFSDTTPGNSGNCGQGDVDQQATSDPQGGTCNVGWTAAGEWLEYDIDSPGGQFDLDLRLASQYANRRARVSLDGQSVGEVTSPSSGWQSWETRTLSSISIPAGSRKLRVTFLTGGLNLNFLTLRAASTGGGGGNGSCEIRGETKRWHRVELRCQGPQASEGIDATFTDYRMQIAFTKGGQTYSVPGHFAADGDAAETGANSGTTWRAYFMPPETGSWSYSVSMRQGSDAAVGGASAGSPLAPLDGTSGSFSVTETDKPSSDMRSRGLLEHLGGERYLRFRGSGRSFVEGGVGSPENLFGYADFDNTTKQSNVGSCKGILHQFAPHVPQWSSGDPSWKNGKGKGLIGLINYVASKGVNVIYLVPMSVNGDGCDGHPWTDYYGDRRNFDVSKLDQWEIAFGHMTRKGLLIHYVTQETENDTLLNSGDLGLERKLYYREIISRFGHHPALQWNLGEENTNTGAQVRSYADFIKQQDPYDHPVVMHTYPGQHNRYNELLGHPTFNGPTLQYGGIPESAEGGVYGAIRDWLQDSLDNGVQWYVTATEASGGDAPTPNTAVTKRQRVYWMWASVMSGGAGFEWYLKNNGAGHAYDLAVEDLREFDQHWEQSGHLVSFWRDTVQGAGVDLNDLAIDNGLTSISSDWVLADPGQAYVVFLRDGGAVSLQLTGGGTYDVSWFNPRTGALTSGGSVAGSGTQNLGSAPEQASQDWVVFVRR